MKTKTVKKHTHSLTNTCITFAQKMRNKDTKQTNSKKKTTEKKTPKNERTKQIRAKECTHKLENI